jgi:hypothetical protein
MGGDTAAHMHPDLDRSSALLIAWALIVAVIDLLVGVNLAMAVGLLAWLSSAQSAVPASPDLALASLQLILTSGMAVVSLFAAGFVARTALQVRRGEPERLQISLIVATGISAMSLLTSGLQFSLCCCGIWMVPSVLAGVALVVGQRGLRDLDIARSWGSIPESS